MPGLCSRISVIRKGVTMKKFLTSTKSLPIALLGLIMGLQPLGTSPAFSAASRTGNASEPAQVSWKTQWDNTVAAAEKEGTVTIYSTPSSDVIRSLANAFEKRYKIKVKWKNGRGEELTTRMQSEKTAGIRSVDVIMSGGTTTQTVMKPRGILGRLDASLILPEVKDPHVWITGQVPYLDKDHTGMALLATFQRYILRNTNLVQPGEITQYTDLLNPKWKGKIVSNDPRVAGTGSAFFTMLALDLWGVDKMKEFMRQFVKQEPAVTRDRRLQGEWVARGKYALSVATNLENAIEFINLGSPVAFCKVKEGGKVGPGAGGLAVPDKPAHPNASKVFINWLLSKEGQTVFVKAYGSPGVRKDAPREGIAPQMFPDPGEKVILDNEASILFRHDITKIAKEIFAPLDK